MDGETTTLGDWPDHWLMMACGRCRKHVDMPINLLLKRGLPGESTILSVVERMKCQGWDVRREKECGGRVSEARLVDRPDRYATGFGGPAGHAGTPPPPQIIKGS